MITLDAPGSKTPEKNPIRMDLYPWANKFAFCFKNSLFSVDSKKQVGLGQLLNLVYFQDIKKNFFEYFKDDVEKAKAKLGSNQAVLEKLNKGKDLTRKEIIELNASLAKIDPQDEAVKDLNFKLKMFLINLDDRCADINWLEDASEIKPPPSYCTKPI